MILISFIVSLCVYGIALVATFLKTIWNRLLVVPLVLALGATAPAAVKDAVVMVGDCSGVCVDPCGLVLTAKHCDHPPVVVVKFKDREVTARRIYVSPEAEGPVMFDCDGDGFPFTRVAEKVPNVGDTVWSYGYPDTTGARQLRWIRGPLLRCSTFEFQGGKFRGNVTGFPTRPGWSGGPLFTRDSEVCGLLNSSDDRTSVFISFGATREAFDTCRNRPQNKPTLYVFGSRTDFSLSTSHTGNRLMTNDAFRWYNVGAWSQYGLAVPNFSNDTQSQNDTIRYLTDVVGRNLQAILWHPDARLRTPPSINTLTRIHKLCTRARSILASRAVPAATLNMETAHALPAAEQFLVYPTPYFKVRNQWLKQYAGLMLLSLTESMQHQENARPLEISEAFAGLIGQYVQRVYRLMATELFRVPLAEASKPDFTISDEQLASYNPSVWFTSTEMLDTVAPLDDWPTEDDLEVLTNGIPISHLPILGRWPNGPTSSVGPGTNGQATVPPTESFAPAPSA